MKSLLAEKTDISLKRHFSVTCVLSLTITLALTLSATSSAEAAGFNVNSEVTFTPLTSTYQTTTNTAGCPTGFAGKFTFTALLTNKPTSAAMPGVAVRVLTLTNGNVLLDPQTNAVLGGEGAIMQVAQTGQYADGLLSAGESVEVPFVLCLKMVQPFQFFVNVFGVVTKLVNVNREGKVIDNVLPNCCYATELDGISANGRYVLFTTAASDLVANDTNGTLDIFVRDLETETNTLVSVNRFGTDSGNGESRAGSVNTFYYKTIISADGRFVAFTSSASDLVANDANGTADVFVRDLQTGTTTLVSVNRLGTNSGNGDSGVQGISADGRFVLFVSGADDLVANDTHSGSPDIFVRDLQAGTTTAVNVNMTGTLSLAYTPVLSANGRFVAFIGLATDFVKTPTSGWGDVYVRDLEKGTTTLVSVNQAGTAGGNSYSSQEANIVVSADGRFVVFESVSTDLVTIPIVAPNGPNVFVRDLQTGTTTLVSVNRFGTNSGNFWSFFPGISADGRFVVFRSGASDLVANDTNDADDIFVRDLQTGTTNLVSVNRFGTNGGNGSSWFSSISADGRLVAFNSFASDLVANDTNAGAAPGNGQLDVFVRDLQTASTTLVSVNRTGTDSGNAGSGINGNRGASIGGLPALGVGPRVVFTSNASDLVANDTNGQGDIFVRPIP